MSRFEFVCAKNDMSKTGASQIRVSQPIISADCTCRLYVLLDKREQTIAGCILQVSQPNSAYYMTVIAFVYLYSYANQCFSGGAASSFSRLCSN